MPDIAQIYPTLQNSQWFIGQPPFRFKSEFLYVLLAQSTHLQVVLLLTGNAEEVERKIAELSYAVESILAECLDELEKLLGHAMIDVEIDAFVLLPDLSESDTSLLMHSVPSEQAVFREESDTFPESRMLGLEPLSSDVFVRLTDILFPKREWRRAELVTDQGRIKRREQRSELDARQKSAAWGLGYESTVIEGGPGSGKSLVLVSRAIWLATALSKPRIVLLAWNKTLAEALAVWLRTLAPETSSTARGTVESLFLAQFLKRHDVELSLADPLDADFRCRDLLKRRRFTASYDAILVDEGQDFGDTLLSLVRTFVIPGQGGLSVSLDASQNIRDRPPIDIDMLTAPSRRITLEQCYRSTLAIQSFSTAFSGGDNKVCGDGASQDIECEKVRLVWAENEAECVAMVVQETKRIIGQLGLQPCEIMAVCFRGEQRNFLESQFRQIGLKTTTPGSLVDGVVLASPEVSKGHEASCVFVLGWDSNEESILTQEEACRRFVASTRAADILYVVYSSQRVPSSLLHCSQAVKQLWPDDFERGDS